MSTRQAVIARYEEDVSWVRGLAMPVRIYNKGKSETGLEGEYEVIARKNVGRETETFLYYIVEEYDRLPDYIAFLQGEPFAHCRNLLYTLGGNTDPVGIVPLSTNWKREFVGNYDWIGFEECLRALAAMIDVPDVMFGYATGAQYLVPKAAILSRPKELYEKLLTRLSQATHPHEAWAMERLWPYLFGFKNHTDNIKIDFLLLSSAVTEPSFGTTATAFEAAAAFVQSRRGDTEFALTKITGHEEFWAQVHKNAQDFVCVMQAGETFDFAFFHELLDAYSSLKMTMFNEDDLVLGFRDEPRLYARENIRPVRIARTPLRHWREGIVTAESFFTHRSVLLQHADLFPDRIPDPLAICNLRGVPFLTPIPTLLV